jgi:hypothetical protein
MFLGRLRDAGLIEVALGKGGRQPGPAGFQVDDGRRLSCGRVPAARSPSPWPAQPERHRRPEHRSCPAGRVPGGGVGGTAPALRDHSSRGCPTRSVAGADGDVLFLNAGIARFAPLGEASPSNFDAMWNVNVRAPGWPSETPFRFSRKAPRSSSTVRWLARRGCPARRPTRRGLAASSSFLIPSSIMRQFAGVGLSERERD